MAHIGNLHANVINIPDNDDSSSTNRILNQGMVKGFLLDLNQPITNIVELNNNSVLGGGYIEYGRNLYGFHSISGAYDSSIGDERERP